MRLNEITQRIPISRMNDMERHELLTFIHQCLSGQFMGPKVSAAHLTTRKHIASLFPPKLPRDPARLFRLVTVDRSFATKKTFTFTPGVGPVSSWTQTLGGLDCVAGGPPISSNPQTRRGSGSPP